MGTNRLGTSSLAIAPGLITLLKDWVTCKLFRSKAEESVYANYYTVSANGLMFLKPQVRRSLLSKMLTEILDTRIMIKKSTKLIDAEDKVRCQRPLHWSHL